MKMVVITCCLKEFNMRKKIQYALIYTYSEGMLHTIERCFDSETKANRFIEELKKEFGRKLEHYRLEKIVLIKEGGNRYK